MVRKESIKAKLIKVLVLSFIIIFGVTFFSTFIVVKNNLDSLKSNTMNKMISDATQV